MEEQIMRDLLKHFEFITVDFGAGELVLDPELKGCLSINEDLLEQ